MTKTPETQKKRDAARIKTQSAKGNLWQKRHPEWCRERMARVRATIGRTDRHYAKMIRDQMNPLHITLDEDEPILVTSDWHIPFESWPLIELLDQVRKDHDVKVLAVAGDFWDCDNYSIFTKMAPMESFQGEIDAVAFVLKWVKRRFKNTFFCAGNHEGRWINLNGGMMDMENLFSLTQVLAGYEVTNDDHLYIHQGDQKWLACHPRNFRITPLSVVRDLASKKQCHVLGGHGHQFTQGWDRSHKFKVADLGGLFDKNALEYLRKTTCHPETANGFYLLVDNTLYPFEIPEVSEE